MLPQSPKTDGDSKSQEKHKSANNKGVTASKSVGSDRSNRPTKVPVDDSTGTKNVTHSDKLSNKPTESDADLAEIVAVWPELPEHIKAAIKALVQTHAKGTE